MVSAEGEYLTQCCSVANESIGRHLILWGSSPVPVISLAIYPTTRPSFSTFLTIHHLPSSSLLSQTSKPQLYLLSPSPSSRAFGDCTSSRYLSHLLYHTSRYFLHLQSSLLQPLVSSRINIDSATCQYSISKPSLSES